MDFRLEPFNLFNHGRLNNPVTINNKNFGKITSSQDPRMTRPPKVNF
jgi:hypothetical protein